MTDLPPPKRRGSLRRQVLLPLLALGLAALLLGTAGTFRLIDFLLERRLREQAESISSSASAVVENIARATELQRVISAMSAEPDVTFIIVVAGDERRVIASSRHKWIGKTLADLPYESLGEDLDFSLRTHQSLNHGHPEIGQFDHSEYARLTLPELAHVAPVDGAVMVRIDTRRIRSDTLRSVMFVMISSTVTLVVLITLGYYLMWRHVVQPLRDVASQMRASDGDLYSVSLGATGGDEMHSLVDALNRSLHERREAENRERQQRQVERLRADLIEELTRPFTSMPAMLRVCCEALSRHLDASFVGIWLLQADSRRLELVASSGLTPRDSGPLVSVKIGETEIGVIARDGRPHLSQTGAKSEWCEMFADATPADLASVAGYPLATEAGMCGVLAVCSRAMLSPEIQLGLNSIASTVVQVILRRQTQDMLHESQEQYRLLADNADDFVLLNDGEGRRLYVSPSYYRVTGWTPEEVQTGDWRRRLHPDDMPTIELARERNRRGEATTIEHRVGCKDGTWIWVELHCKPILSADGRVEKLLQWSRDITERKKNAELLQEALKAAEAANEAKSEFLAIMSHEIRTPINGIMGMLDLTLETPLADDQHEQLTLARSAADSLRAILNDILDFSKIEAGKLQLEHAPFSLRKTIAQAVRTISLRAAEKQLEVRIEELGEIPDTVIGDGGRLTQVLLNLLSNAVKFTERGS
ncbi:MAG TPA: PAS domain S-box protein, partial [Pirellulaceae bacterium]|nr:PAS domain S-box protein [Pirellulaceae bacterium]